MLTAPLDALQGREATNPFVLKTPLLDLLTKYSSRSHVDLNYTSITMPFIMQLKVSLVIGIVLALPLIVYEIWAFISAGLYPRERRAVRIYGPASFLLFVAGAALAYFIVLPLGAVFLIGKGDTLGLKPMLTIDEYAPFVMWLIVGFGLTFQTPLVILFLARLGLVHPRTFVKYRRHAILAIFVIAAVVTPPDPFTQIAVAIPMLGLYELSIVLARFAVRKRTANAEA